MICSNLSHPSHSRPDPNIAYEHEVTSSLFISLCHVSLLTPSIAYTEYFKHRAHQTCSAIYTQYSLHHVPHHPKFDCLLLPASLPALSGPCCTQITTFPPLGVKQWIKSQRPSHMAPNPLPSDSLPPDPLSSDWLPPDWPPPGQPLPYSPPASTPPNLFYHGLQVFLPKRGITASKGICKWNQYRPPSPSQNILDHHLQVYLQHVTAGVQRYMGNRGAHSDGEYIISGPWST